MDTFEKIFFKMKRILFPILLCLAACQADPIPSGNTPSGGGQGNDGVLIAQISVVGSIDIAENAATVKVPVSLEPSEASLSADAIVRCEQDGVLNYNVLSDGIEITPVKQGNAVFTISPKKGPAADASFTVHVLEKEPALVSIGINKVGDSFSGGKLILTETGSFQLEATVMNEKGNASMDRRVWTLKSGSGVVSLGENGLVTALKAGDAVVSVSPASAPNLKDELSISVAEISTVNFTATGGSFENGVLPLSEGGSVQLTAIVKNSQGKVFNTPVTWSVAEGTCVSVDQTGKVSAKASSGTAKVKATVTAKPSVSGTASIRIVPNPQSIEIYGNPNLNIPEELKKGGNTTLKVRVLPADAVQDVNVVVNVPSGANNSCTLKATTTVSGGYTNIKLQASSTSDVKYREVVITSVAKSSVSASWKFYICDYYDTDLKVGDYVYYSSSTGKFVSRDSGRRCGDSFLNDSYQMGSQPKTPPTVSGYSYIGVIGSTNVPSADDFLKASMLSGCADPVHKNISGLRRSTLIGLDNNSGAHVLVVAAKHTDATVWQVSSADGKLVAEDTGINVYPLFPLRGTLALSQYEQENGHGTTYVEYGFLSYRLLKRYNGLQTNQGSKVSPVLSIASYTPSIEPATSGQTSTGWFLPGKGDVSLVENAALVALNNSLSDPIPTDTYYWSVEEHSGNFAGSYARVKDFWDNMSDRKSKSFRARAFLYL